MRKDTIEKLEKVSNHLKNGVLGHKNFDFSSYNEGDQDKNGCGTSGCAVGEFPLIFPEFKFYNYGVRLKEQSLGDTETDARVFLNISSSEYEHLFIPNRQHFAYGKGNLDMIATKEEVAANIDAFIEYLNRE